VKVKGGEKMKNLRYIITLSIILIVITTLFSMQNVLAEEGTGTITGSVTGIMKMPKSKELKEALKNVSISKYGWFEKEQYLQKKVYFNKATLSIAGIETMTDENGLFILENVPIGEHIIKVYDIERKQLLEKIVKVKVGKENHVDIKIVYEVEKGKNCCEMNSESALSITLKKFISSIFGLFTNSEAYAVYPCRDYNGPL
jgi:hypothetical protein